MQSRVQDLTFVMLAY